MLILCRGQFFRGMLLLSSYPEIQKFPDLEISGFGFGNEIFFLFNKEIK